MKEVLLFVLVGVGGGVLGGMGLGGGTLLIPLLTLVLGVHGRVAAWLNLITFLPMSAVALVIHAKNKMVSWRDAFCLAPFALLSALAFSLLSSEISSKTLKIAFGWFLIALGSASLLFSLVKSIFSARRRKRAKMH